jgi:hypothetical protein
MQLTGFLAREPTNKPVGTTTNQPTDASTPSLTPFKQQRPFSSGPRGFTVWYSTRSHHRIAAPAGELEPSAGCLYVHTHLLDISHQVWLCGIHGKWEDVTENKNISHPTLTNRVLVIRADGSPSWVTTASFTTMETRRGKAQAHFAVV